MTVLVQNVLDGEQDERSAAINRDDNAVARDRRVRRLAASALVR